jgi:hypothetical protein
MVRCTWYNFILFISLTPTDGEVYLIQLYLIFDFHRWWGVLDTTLSDFWLPRWWGVLDTTWSDFWLSPMVRCTWYNFIWFLTVTDGGGYLIQFYLIFDSHRWWGVLDTTLSDFWLPRWWGVLDTTLSYLLVWLPPMVRCTWYNFILFISLTATHGEVYLIQLYLIY